VLSTSGVATINGNLDASSTPDFVSRDRSAAALR
jgi:hypothetical protein